MKYICSKCMKKVDIKTHQPKCECGGLWKLEFTPPLFDINLIDRALGDYLDIGLLCQLKMIYGRILL